MKRLSIVVRPRTQEFLIGGRTDPERGGAKATARDAQGRLVLPASALRGALRVELERLRRGLGEEACSANLAPRDQDESCRCPVCRLFGTEGSASGALRLTDAVLDGGEAPRRLRPQVAVSRSTGSAVAQHLVFAETGRVADAGEAAFRTEAWLVPLGTDGDDDGEEDLRQLRAACAALSALGGGRSRGLGWVTCEVEVVGNGDRPRSSGTTVDRKATAALAGSVEVTFEAQAPLHLGAGRPIGAFHRTLRHVPASTVRGALAFALLDAGLASSDEEGFQDLFGSAAAARFGSARLEGPLPSATLRRCRPGRHLFDDLPAELLRREAASRGLALALGEDSLCPVADCRAAKVARFIGQPSAERLDLRVRTRSALNRRTSTSMDAKLFSVEVIEPWWGEEGSAQCVRFTTRLDGLTPAAAATLGRLDGGRAWVGGKRSQGYGACRVTVAPAAEPASEEIAAAVERFNSELREAWGALAGAAGLDSELLAADRLLLPVVLDEPWLAADAGQRSVEEGPLALPLYHRFLTVVSVGGFAAVEARRYGAPAPLIPGERPAVTALAAGSLFVYELPRARLAEAAGLLAAAGADDDGRALGRGRVRLWQPSSNRQQRGARR